MAEMRPGKGDDDNRQQQRGDGEQGVEDMVHHRRAQAVGRSGNHAQHQTKQRGAEGDDKSAADGGRRAAQQSAQHIAAEVIGSQKEGDFAIARPRRRQQLVAEELLVDAVGGEPAAEDAEQQQARAAVQTDHRRGVAIELTPYGAQRAGRTLFQINAIVGHTIPYVSVG